MGRLALFLVTVFLVANFIDVVWLRRHGRYRHGDCRGKKETTALCPPYWKEYRGHCYFFSENKCNWWEAKKACEKRSAYLVRIEDRMENNWLKMQSKLHPSAIFGNWIGATDQQSAGDWRWESNGRRLTFRDFAPGNPVNSNNEHCVCMCHGPKQWHDGTCNLVMHFVCERKLTGERGVSTTSPDSKLPTVPTLS